jgi:hypothetical protein
LGAAILRTDLRSFLDVVVIRVLLLTLDRPLTTVWRMQPRLSIDNVKALIDKIDLGKLLDSWHFRVLEKGDGFLLQLRFIAHDTETGEYGVLQSCRKWYVSPYSTSTEVVETAFKACRMAVEHELRESFRYEEQAVYSPHFSIEDRVEMCRLGTLDRRKRT